MKSAVPFIILVTVSAKTLPPNITKCQKSDPNLNQCLDKYVMEGVRKFASGNRDLGIPPLEPFYIEKIDLQQDGSGPISLQHIYYNVNIHGITSATIRDSDADFKGDNCYWNYNSYTPSIRMEGDYIMKGQLLLFPINGHGRCNNTFSEIDGRNEFKCEKYTKKGKTHLRMIDHVFKISPKRVSFDFENIIEGNEKLSNELRKTVNENSLLVYADIDPAMEEVMGQIWVQTINEVFSRVPEDELFA